MKNEGNLSMAAQSLIFNNKIKTIMTVPIVSFFNHLPPAGTINNDICRDVVIYLDPLYLTTKPVNIVSHACFPKKIYHLARWWFIFQ